MSDLYAPLMNTYRKARVVAKQIAGIEPVVQRGATIPLEFHGAPGCGWAIPKNVLGGESIVVDVGLGEELSFPASLIDRYGCTVHGFDPTPRAIAFAKQACLPNFRLHEYGVAGTAGEADFHLPSNAKNVSGSLARADHLMGEVVRVRLVDLPAALELSGVSRVDLLKMDVEGAEYDILRSETFKAASSRIGIFCVEFHHRWREFGKLSTVDAVRTLSELGFSCVWRSAASNEEFTFANRHVLAKLAAA